MVAQITIKLVLGKDTLREGYSRRDLQYIALDQRSTDTCNVILFKSLHCKPIVIICKKSVLNKIALKILKSLYV